MRKNDLMRAIWAAVTLFLAGSSGAVAATVCRDLTHLDQEYTVCEANRATDDLRLFLTAPDGKPYGSFDRVNEALTPAQLGFAMNAGMYHADRTPVGLYVESGKPEGRLITSDGPGNFGLLPNGVFCIAPGRYSVIESLRFAENAPDCDFASQSGPMLVIDGDLHPKFLPRSTSRYIRNGVGVAADGQTAYFAISKGAVTFHEFGVLFRDVLNTPNALYFDGNISRLHAPDLGRSDFGFAMGPIVGLVAPAE